MGGDIVGCCHKDRGDPYGKGSCFRSDLRPLQNRNVKQSLVAAKDVKTIINYKRLFPIMQMDIVDFVDQVKSIEGSAESFTIQQMSEKFQTPIWIQTQQWEEDSELTYLLQALPGFYNEPNRLSKMSVLCLGFLWCKSDHYKLAEMFYDFLNPPEANQNDKVVTCNDKKWQNVFDTLIEIATMIIPEAFADFQMRQMSKQQQKRNLSKDSIVKASLNPTSTFQNVKMTQEIRFNTEETFVAFTSTPSTVHETEVQPSQNQIKIDDLQNSILKTESDMDIGMQQKMFVIEAMRICEIDDPTDIQGLIPAIFLTESKLEKQQFIQRLLSKECQWVLSEAGINQKFFRFLRQDNLKLLQQEFGSDYSSCIFK